MRPATPADRAACYRVCLQTSDNGADGTHLHDDPDLLGHIYVGPYLEFEPSFSFVLEDAAGVCGYCLGTPDSTRFYRRFEREWLPAIQRAVPKPAGQPAGWTLTQQLQNVIHHPAPLMHFPPEFGAWPAHGHIDLLPRVQGRGWGRRLMELQMERLRDAGATGMHLCVAPGNSRAQAFYRRLGFFELDAGTDQPPDTLFLGRTL
ncbi:MAG TPA: GNAT family N-acetyltransferase [Verrucomicrobiales bacterium]|nr:GNAT family N-acetyltransferase [Verrucomicrobiales bacterium]